MKRLLLIFSDQKFWLVTSILGILVLGLQFTSGLEKMIDIRLWDETGYLFNGVNFFCVKADPGWGPLYSLWYFFLSLLTKDNINLYYLNYKLTTIVPCILLFVFLYRLKISPAISFYISSAFMFSLINLPVWPRISHFCITVILAGFILITIVKDKDKKIICALFLSLICTFIRPEFLISFFILMLYSTYRVFRNRRILKLYITVVFIAALMIIVIGFPYSADRNLTAFGQAFDKDFSVNQRMDSNGIKDWQQILKEHFENVKSVPAAFFNNPGDFIHHLTINSLRLKSLIYTLSETLVPINIFHFNYIILALLLMLLPIAAFIRLFFDKQGTINKEYLSSLTLNKHLLIITIILTIPALAEIIIYYPRSHYIILLLPAFYLIIGFMLFPFSLKSIPLNGVIILFLFILSLLFMPSLNNYFKQPVLTNINIINEIRGLNIKKEVNFLENEGGYSVYLGNNFKTVNVDGIEKSFPALLKDKNVNLIYPTNNLEEVLSPEVKSGYRSFLNNYESFNYSKLILKGGDYILINNDLIK